MKAAVLYEPNTPLVIEDVAVRKPGPREVLVKTSYAGLCHSDLHVMEGLYPHPMPMVLGHESSGIVEQVGSQVTYVKPGDPVITCLSVFCGICESCLSGKQVLCEDTDVKHPPGATRRLEWEKTQQLHTFANLSSFAEQMLVHENALVKVRPEMPMDRAALIGCGIITGFGAAANAAGIRWGETVVIIGCGGVGMAALEGAYVSGAGRIIAVDTNPSKLQTAAKLGASDLVDASRVDPVEAVVEMTAGGAHHAIECIGLKSTMEQAFAMTRPGGTATMVGMMPVGETVELDALQMLRGRKFQGAMMGAGSFRLEMPRLVDLYLQGRLHLDDWISETIALEEINEGYVRLKAGRVLRSLIEFT